MWTSTRSTLWFPLFSVLWIVAFACFVWNRFVAARVLVLLGAASAIGLAVAVHVVFLDETVPPIAVTDVTRWAWLVGLAVMAGGMSGVRLLSALLRPWPIGQPPHVVQADVLSAVVLVVAVVCVAVGLLRWRRVPAR